MTSRSTDWAQASARIVCGSKKQLATVERGAMFGHDEFRTLRTVATPGGRSWSWAGSACELGLARYSSCLRRSSRRTGRSLDCPRCV